MSLFKKSKLTFIHYGEEVDDDYGRPITPVIGDTEISGSLQSMDAAEKTRVLPEGKRTSKAYIFFTKSKVALMGAVGSIPADKTIIDGREYEVWEGSDWTKVSSLLKHNEYVLVSTEQ